MLRDPALLGDQQTKVSCLDLANKFLRELLSGIDPEVGWFCISWGEVVSTDNEKLLFCYYSEVLEGDFPCAAPPPRLSSDSNTSPTTRRANFWPESSILPI